MSGLEKGLVIIPKNQNLFPDDLILVDQEDYDLLNTICWRVGKVHNVKYAVATIKRQTIRMHRLLLPNAQQIDHINRNGLDNRKSNLRECTHSQNRVNFIRFNKHGFRGVHFHKPSGLYMARIHWENKSYSLGYYKTKEEAAKAYNERAVLLHGEFAVLNEEV